MKLLTEISGNDDDVILVCNGDVDVPGDEQMEHDAMAAHALMRAMEDLNHSGWTRYQNPIHAAICRADEILAGWTGAGDA